MTLTRPELLTAMRKSRDDLVLARASGVRQVRDQNGETIEYKSDAEMASALRGLDAEIRNMGGVRPQTILFRTSKGL